MREESIQSYIWFGTVLRFLQDSRQGRQIHGDGRTEENLRAFLDGLKNLGLTVTANAAFQEGLHNTLAEFEAAPADGLLDSQQAKQLAESVTSVRKTLTAESLEKKAFVTAPKRWDVDRLLSEPGAMFGQGVFDQLSSQSAFDFAEACRCIAFELPTASAFHVMRGTESVLRSYYCHVVRQKRLKIDRRMWGPMVDQMKRKSRPPPKALLDNLDAIRHNFRNPTQHPDEIYTIDRAQDLLGLVIPVINQMTDAMRG